MPIITTVNRGNTKFIAGYKGNIKLFPRIPSGVFGAAIYYDSATGEQAVSNSILPSITKPTITYGPTFSGIITNLQNNIYYRSSQWCSFDLNIPAGVSKVVIAPNVGWDDSTKGSYEHSRLFSSSGLYWTNGGGNDTGTWINQPYTNANSFEQKVLGTTTQYCTKGRVRYLSLSVTPGATYHMVMKNAPVTEKNTNHPGWNFIFGPYVDGIAAPKRDATAYATVNATLTVSGDYGSYQFNHLYSPTGTTLGTATLSVGATRTVPKGSIISWSGPDGKDYYGGTTHSASCQIDNRPYTYMVVNDMILVSNYEVDPDNGA